MTNGQSDSQNREIDMRKVSHNFFNIIQDQPKKNLKKLIGGHESLAFHSFLYPL